MGVQTQRREGKMIYNDEVGKMVNGIKSLATPLQDLILREAMTDRDYANKAAAELLALRERVAKLERIETIAREILDAVKSGVVVRDAEPCKHGNFATAPYNHPRWCDECFFELEDALSQ